MLSITYSNDEGKGTMDSFTDAGVCHLIEMIVVCEKGSDAERAEQARFGLDRFVDPQHWRYRFQSGGLLSVRERWSDGRHITDIQCHKDSPSFCVRVDKAGRRQKPGSRNTVPANTKLHRDRERRFHRRRCGDDHRTGVEWSLYGDRGSRTLDGLSWIRGTLIFIGKQGRIISEKKKKYLFFAYTTIMTTYLC